MLLGLLLYMWGDWPLSSGWFPPPTALCFHSQQPAPAKEGCPWVSGALVACVPGEQEVPGDLQSLRGNP